VAVLAKRKTFKQKRRAASRKAGRILSKVDRIFRRTDGEPTGRELRCAQRLGRKLAA